MAHFLSIAPTTISTSTSMGTNGMPQCSFKAPLVAHKRVDAIANVDNGPQPYFRLERTALEASQTFGTPRLSPAPEAVFHLGLEADWFPAYPQLMATDGKLLITLAVTWNGAPQSRQRQLAVAMTRTYLHTPHGKAAQALAKGTPRADRSPEPARFSAACWSAAGADPGTDVVAAPRILRRGVELHLDVDVPKSSVMQEPLVLVSARGSGLRLLDRRLESAADPHA